MVHSFFLQKVALGNESFNINLTKNIIKVPNFFNNL